MKYNSIAITIGNQCNAACSICCMKDDENKCFVDTKLIKTYIKSASNEEKIKAVCFTGGEVFLYYELLKELIHFTKKCNKKCGVISNGFWGKDYQYATKVMKELGECGLDYITLSYDAFHAEYISSSAISNILEISKNTNIDVSIQSVMTEHISVSSWLSKIGTSINDVRIEFVPCMPVGLAKDNVQEQSYIREYSMNGLRCRKSGSFSIGLDGTVWPCCSPLVTETSLAVDNIKDNTDVTRTLMKLSKHAILHALRNYGFDFFVDIAINEFGMSLPKKYTSSCELCSILFNSINIDRFLPFIHRRISVDTIR